MVRKAAGDEYVTTVGMEHGDKRWEPGDVVVPGSLPDETFDLYVEQGSIVKIGSGSPPVEVAEVFEAPVEQED